MAHKEIGKVFPEGKYRPNRQIDKKRQSQGIVLVIAISG